MSTPGSACPSEDPSSCSSSCSRPFKTSVALNPLLSAAIPLSFPRTAARDVYLIVELRHHIFEFLPRASLAKCMRLEQASMPSVAKILYRQMEYNQVKSALSISPARDQIYRAGVVIIDTQNIFIPPHLHEAVGLGPKPFAATDTETIRQYVMNGLLRNFRPEAFHAIVPHLRERFQALRMVYFCRRNVYNPDSEPQCIVYFGARDESSDNDGHIEFITSKVISIVDKPPTGFSPPSSPSSRYTASERFGLTLDLRTGVPSPTVYQQNVDTWVQAVRTAPFMLNLYRYVDFATLPVSLDDMLCLYERHAASRSASTEGLGVLTPLATTPFTAGDFSTFASVAGRSLTKLHLLSACPNLTLLPAIGLADIPHLVNTIQFSMPNLVDLALTLGVQRTAESDCQELLHGALPNRTGNIKRLYIDTVAEATTEPGLYNILRCLYPILAPISSRASSDIDVDIGAEMWWDCAVQSDFIRYLQMQTPERQYHLSTVDFPSLDIVRPKDLLWLSFDAEHRPIRRWAMKVNKWSKEAEGMGGVISTTQPRLEQILRDFVAVPSQFERSAAVNIQTGDTKIAAEKLLSVINALQGALEMANGLEADVVYYLRSLDSEDGWYKDGDVADASDRDTW